MRRTFWLALLFVGCSKTNQPETPPRAIAPATAPASEPATKAAAKPPSCPVCDGLASVGDNFFVRVVSKPAREDAAGDVDTTVEIFTKKDGGCCPDNKKLSFGPGTFLWWTDTRQSQIYLRGHDARWSAIASDGIWRVNLATQESTQVADHLLTEISCEKNRFAAIVREPGKKPNDDFNAGLFRLNLYDFAEGKEPSIQTLAEDSWLSTFAWNDSDAEEKAKKFFRWSEDCKTFFYKINKKKEASVVLP